MKNRSKVCWDSGWIELGPIHCFDGSNARCYAQECELKRSVFIKSLELQKQYTTSYGFYSLNKTNSVSKSNQSPSSLIYYLFVSRTEQREAKIRNGNSRDPQSFRETHRSVPHFPISLPFLHFSFRKLSLSLSFNSSMHLCNWKFIYEWYLNCFCRI